MTKTRDGWWTNPVGKPPAEHVRRLESAGIAASESDCTAAHVHSDGHKLVDVIAGWWVLHGEPTPAALATAERWAQSVLDRADEAHHGPAGLVLDTTALSDAARSTFLQAILQFGVADRRALLVPSTALATAAARIGMHPADLATIEGLTISVPTSALITGVPDIVEHAAVTGLDTLHAAWLARTTGYPVLTRRPCLYRGLDLQTAIEVPDSEHCS